jgi:hypothetical protein
LAELAGWLASWLAGSSCVASYAMTTLETIDMAIWMGQFLNMSPEEFISAAQCEGYETFIVLRNPSTVEHDETHMIVKVGNNQTILKQGVDHTLQKQSIDELIRYYR